ncbi:solute carrier family 23 protein [Streptomyces sp. L7]
MIFGAVIVAGLLGFLAAPFFSRAVRFFPPVVTGTVITLIGVSATAGRLRLGTGPGPSAHDYAVRRPAPGLAAAALVIVLVLRRFTRASPGTVAVLLGLLLGTLLAIPLRLQRTSPRSRTRDVIGFHPFHFGAPQFQLAAIVSMCVVMVVLDDRIHRRTCWRWAEDRPNSPRTRRLIAAEPARRHPRLGHRPLFNGFMCSAFAQNIGLVAMTRIRSRYVVATGGGFLVADGPVPDRRVAHRRRTAARCWAARGVVLFGSVAASGNPDPGRGGPGEGRQRPDRWRSPWPVGIIPITAPDFYHAFPGTVRIVLDSGISTGCVAAVALNLVFNHLGRVREQTRGTTEAAPLAGQPIV